MLCMMMNMKTKLLAFFALLFLSLHSQAGHDFGVHAQSLGGAIRAKGSSNDVIFYNPAAIIKHRQISPEADYLFDMSYKSHRIGASIVDSKTSTWGLGLAYNGCFINRGNESSSHLFYLASAMPLGIDLLSLGAALSYDYNKNIGPDDYRHFFNLDLGLLGSLPIGLSFALAADHLFAPKGNEKPLGLSLGSAYDLGVIMPNIPLSFSFDWLMDDVSNDDDLSHILGGGIQFIAAHLVPLRVGFKSNSKKNQKLLSMGSGIISGPLAIDALYAQDLLIGKNRHFGLALRLAL